MANRRMMSVPRGSGPDDNRDVREKTEQEVQATFAELKEML